MPSESEISTMHSPVADNLQDDSKDTDADKPLQELLDCDNILVDEDKVSSLPTYETTARLHTVELSELPTVLTPITGPGDLSKNGDADKSLQELDEDKAASLSTYETTTRLHNTVEPSELPTVPTSPISDNIQDISKNRDADKLLQELPNHDKNKATIIFLPICETATKLKMKGMLQIRHSLLYTHYVPSIKLSNVS